MSLRDELLMGQSSAAEVQKAYDEAGRYEFNGRRLEPWTVRRQSVAIALGSRIMRGMSDENNSVENYLATGFYPHVFRDLVLCLYLMHLDKRQVIDLEQLSKADAMSQVYDWAESVPITYGSAIFFEGAKVMGKVLHAMQVSWFQVARSDTEGSDNGQKKILTSVDTEQPGNSNSVSERSGQPDSTPNML